MKPLLETPSTRDAPQRFIFWASELHMLFKCFFSQWRRAKRDAQQRVCVLQVAPEGGGEDFLPKAWGKFH